MATVLAIIGYILNFVLHGLILFLRLVLQDLRRYMLRLVLDRILRLLRRPHIEAKPTDRRARRYPQRHHHQPDRLTYR